MMLVTAGVLDALCGNQISMQCRSTQEPFIVWFVRTIAYDAHIAISDILAYVFRGLHADTVILLVLFDPLLLHIKAMRLPNCFISP